MWDFAFWLIMVYALFKAVILFQGILQIDEHIREHAAFARLHQGGQTSISIDVARIWIRIIKIDGNWVELHYKLFRREQLLHESKQIIEFDEASGESWPVIIFPESDYPFKSLFEARVGLDPADKVVRVVLTVEPSEGKPWGGVGFGW